MKGFLIYELNEIERNQGFINLLIQAAKSNNIELSVIDDKQQIPDADFFFFRARNPKLAKELEQRNIPMFNRAEVNVIANDKRKATQLVQLLGIATVPTRKIQSVTNLRDFPIVLKTVDGHGGSQVELINSLVNAEEFMSNYRDQTIIVQPFIESNATDIRVFMLGKEVFGAVKRTGGKDSFKSNFTLGGTVEPYMLDSKQLAEVEKIATALKSDYIGIDFLLLPDGNWLFNEIEDPVGARSYYETTGKDIAVSIMAYIQKRLFE